MDRARVRDWLIGAAGAVLLLLLLGAVLWWAVTEPVGRDGEGPDASPGTPEPVPSADPPAGLDEEEVWLDELTLDAGTVVTASSSLREVSATGQDVLTGPDGLVAAHVAVAATVPFPVVAGELGAGTTVRAGDGGQAVVERTVEVWGRQLRVVATGTVEVESGTLVVEPRHIDVGGPDLLGDAIAAAVRGLVTIEHEIEGLPEGLELQDVAVQQDGFRAQLAGEDVSLLP